MIPSRPRRRVVVVAGSVLAVALVAWTSSATRPAAAAPPAQPAAPKPAEARPAGDATKVFDYLMKEYTALLGKTHDRLGRSLLLVCMSRVPRADATAELTKVLKTDKDPLVQAVAWQCLLARASGMTEAEFNAWVDATAPLVPRGVFRGDMRAMLARVLACAAPNQRGRDAFAQLFAQTNILHPDDGESIMALGACLAAWKDPATVDWLLGRFGNVSEAYRAEHILRSAGANVELPSFEDQIHAGSVALWQEVSRRYATWWRAERANWVPRKGPEGWKSLQAEYVPAVDFAAKVDPDDPKWYRDVELRPPGLKTFGVGVMLDTTGSMQSAIMWLRSDARRMMQAFGLVALEPQIGLTLYRDFGDAYVAKTTPLTGNVEQLVKVLYATEAKGGGDYPEAIREALKDALSVNRFVTSAKTPKALILVGDAPAHPETQPECEKIVADAAKQGFRTYVVKIRSGYEKEEQWPALDKLAEAGAGSSMTVDFHDVIFAGGNLPMATLPGGAALQNMGMPAGPITGVVGLAGRRSRGSAAPSTAFDRRGKVGKNGNVESAPDDSHLSPGERVVTRVVVDVVSPQYADRVQPVVTTLWQMLAGFEPEKRTPSPPVPKFTPPPMVNLPPPPPMRPLPPPPPMKPPEPFDPQKQR